MFVGYFLVRTLPFSVAHLDFTTAQIDVEIGLSSVEFDSDGMSNSCDGAVRPTCQISLSAISCGDKFFCSA